MNSDTITIRQGHKGNGHYIAFYWSFSGYTPDGGREIISGDAQTWDAALEAATAAQRDNLICSMFEDMTGPPMVPGGGA